MNLEVKGVEWGVEIPPDFPWDAVLEAERTGKLELDVLTPYAREHREEDLPDHHERVGLELIRMFRQTLPNARQVVLVDEYTSVEDYRESERREFVDLVKSWLLEQGIPK